MFWDRAAAYAHFVRPRSSFNVLPALPRFDHVAFGSTPRVDGRGARTSTTSAYHLKHVSARVLSPRFVVYDVCTDRHPPGAWRFVNSRRLYPSTYLLHRGL